MEHMIIWTVLFHVIGLVFWIGGLLVATALLGQHADESFDDGRAALARAEVKILNGMANPGAVITVITGIILLYGRMFFYLHSLWFQAKMILVLCLIVLHVITYARARKFVAGELLVPRKNWMILHGAISFVFFAILICVLPGRIYWK
ncbi:MAG: CopD family protein [Terriglobia bacterium]